MANLMDVPSGLADSFPTCVWARQHSGGPWLCIYRIGDSAAVVWRTYAFVRSWAYCIAEYDSQGGDSIEQAKAHAQMLLDDSDAAPEALLPKNREAERREKAAGKAAKSPASQRGQYARERKTPEEKARSAAERQARYRARKAGTDSIPGKPVEETPTPLPPEIEKERLATRAALAPHLRKSGQFAESQIQKFSEGAPDTGIARWIMTEEGKAAMRAAMQETQANPG